MMDRNFEDPYTFAHYSITVGGGWILWTASRATAPNDRRQSAVRAGVLYVRQPVSNSDGSVTAAKPTLSEHWRK